MRNDRFQWQAEPFQAEGHESPSGTRVDFEVLDVQILRSDYLSTVESGDEGILVCSVAFVLRKKA